MSRGPDRKELDEKVLKKIVADLELACTEDIRKEYRQRSDDSAAWNTLHRFLQDSDDFILMEVGDLNAWALREKR